MLKVILITQWSRRWGVFWAKLLRYFHPEALNETNFQTKIKTIKLHLLDMNPYLARHVGIVDAPSDIWH